MQAIAEADNETDSVVSFNDTDDDLNLENEKEKKVGCVGCLRDNLFMILILLGVVVGFGIGFGVRQLNPSPVAITWIAMPGDLYIRLLQLTILPLIASNLIIVISSLDPKEQGLSSLLTVAYIIGFNFAGAAIGTTFATLIKPGIGVNMTKPSTQTQDPGLTPTTSDVFADLLLNMFPDNVVGMTLFSTKTDYCWKYPNQSERYSERVNGNSTDLIGVLFTCIAFGLAARMAGEAGKPFLDFFRALSDVVLKLVRVFLRIVSLAEMFDGCDQYGVDQSISRFACPLMTALKADGPAVFISSAAVFVAQTESAGSSPGTLVIIWILTAVSALAIPHIPSASIIITMTILSSANVPTANTAYLYAVDWLLDRFRAGAVTIGVMYGASLADSISKRRKKSRKVLENNSISSINVV